MSLNRIPQRFPTMVVLRCEKSMAPLVDFLAQNQVVSVFVPSLNAALEKLTSIRFELIVCDSHVYEAHREECEDAALGKILKASTPLIVADSMQLPAVRFRDYCSHSIYSFRQQSLIEDFESMIELASFAKQLEIARLRSYPTSKPHFPTGLGIEYPPNSANLFIME